MNRPLIKSKWATRKNGTSVAEKNLLSMTSACARMARMQEKTEPPFEMEGERQVDPGIRREVSVLWENGIETFKSCEGGDGHSFFEPTVRFFGGKAEGFKALGIALENGLKVSELRRYWSIEDGEPIGPHWEMTFFR